MSRHSSLCACQHQTCDRQIGRGLFACTQHWFQLSPKIRKGITSAFARFQREATQETVDALHASHKAAWEFWEGMKS